MIIYKNLVIQNFQLCHYLYKGKCKKADKLNLKWNISAGGNNCWRELSIPPHNPKKKSANLRHIVQVRLCSLLK